jgi:dTDP-4-amino-4,6-dideoxygalactose transaminase
MNNYLVPFSKATLIGKEISELQRLYESSDNSASIKKVNAMIKRFTFGQSVYFCNSCSDALEISALALGLNESHEVIVPDYTFVTSASTFALRNAKICFCDITLNDMCLDLKKAEKLITNKTKALVWVDYAGCANRVKEARKLCDKYGLILIQDAAQSFGNWHNESVSNLIQGDFVTYSFHSTKNITSGGEGGCLILNNNKYQDKVDVIFEKGTNRREFLRGDIDKYTWRDLGSSYAGSYSQAALLIPQLENLEFIINERVEAWSFYHKAFSLNKNIELSGWRLPHSENIANAHIFWLLAPSEKCAINLRKSLLKKGVQSVAHYQSLYNSPAGQRYGKSPLSLENSSYASKCLVRLPLWHGIKGDELNLVVNSVNTYIDTYNK